MLYLEHASTTRLGFMRNTEKTDLCSPVYRAKIQASAAILYQSFPNYLAKRINHWSL